MHQRLIVVSKNDNHPKEWHEDNAELDEPIGLKINEFVYDYLQENAFASEGARWTNGPADWFVIGGRWSGNLTQKELGLNYKGLRTEFIKRGYPKTEVDEKDVALFEKEENFMISNGFIKALTGELNLLWTDLGGDDDHPWVRDSYRHTGYADDSKRLNQDLYDNLFNAGDYSSEESWIDIDPWEGFEKWENLKEHINRRDVWLTVIDYHN